MDSRGNFWNLHGDSHISAGVWTIRSRNSSPSIGDPGDVQQTLGERGDICRGLFPLSRPDTPEAVHLVIDIILQSEIFVDDTLN
jgi:hypothetical protein